LLFGLVLCLVDQRAGLDPRHHAAELFADFFDLVLVIEVGASLTRGSNMAYLVSSSIAAPG
jgi:hypothetical protein